MAIGDLGSHCSMPRVDGVETCVQIDRVGDTWRLTHAGIEATVQVLTPRVAELNRLMPVRAPPDHSRFILSPMPGLLIRIAVEEGMEVVVGDEVAVIEAMKMENQIVAVSDGTVRTIHAAPGDLLEVDQPIVEFA